jgi:hypothetical protein
MGSATIYHSWSTARGFAALITFVVFVLLGVIGAAARRMKGSRAGGLLNGLDNRWSTSKVSIVLWTAAVLWAFLTLLIRYGGSAAPDTVPATYLALLAIPSAGALGAKAIAGQRDGKTLRDAPTMNPLAGIGQIFSDDTGSVDLLDTQYFLFNLVLLGYFIASFWHTQEPAGTNIPLPTLPGSLLALAGVSTATYLGKKGLSGATNQVLGGASLTVTADSDVALPGGGTVTLSSPGSVTIYPGVTYTSQSSATVEQATGGELKLGADGPLKLAAGAVITGPSGSIVTAVSDATAMVSTGSQALKSDRTAADDAGAAGKSLLSGATVTLVPNGQMVLTSDDTTLDLKAGISVRYAGAGSATVAGAALAVMVSPGATLGHQQVGSVTFPDGGLYVDAVANGSVQEVARGGDLALSAAVQGKTPARSYTLVDGAHVLADQGTTITFPDKPVPIGQGIKSTAATQTTLNLSSGGKVDIEGTDAPAAARVPNGATISVPSGAKAATVTADAT